MSGNATNFAKQLIKWPGLYEEFHEVITVDTYFALILLITIADVLYVALEGAEFETQLFPVCIIKSQSHI